MDEATAKIVKIDTSKLAPTSATKDTASDAEWRGTSETSLLVEVAHGEHTYTRKITFRVHDHKIHNIGGALTPQDVERAILEEVDQIKSLHAIAELFEQEIGVDQIEKVSRKRLEQQI